MYHSGLHLGITDGQSAANCMSQQTTKTLDDLLGQAVWVVPMLTFAHMLSHSCCCKRCTIGMHSRYLVAAAVAANPAALVAAVCAAAAAAAAAADQQPKRP